MSKRRVYLILGVVILAGVLVAVFRRDREPEYGGKRLSEWVLVIGHSDPATGSIQRAEAADAIRKMGTNAFPYLLKWISYETPAWKARLARAVHPVVTKVFLGLQPFWEREEQEADIRADVAAVVLVKPRQREVLELEKLVLNPKGTENLVWRVSGVLSRSGQLGMPAVLALMTNHPPAWSLGRLDVALSRLRDEAQPAIPVLKHLLTDPDPQVRQFATNNLRVFEWHPPGPAK